MTKILPGRKLMKIIGGGHEVPWPETLVAGNFVFPKDYRMNAFPRTPEGAMWYDIPDDEYLSWLADYLPDNLLELTPDQQQVYDNWDRYNLLSGFWIGDRGGWHENEAAVMPNYSFPSNFHTTGDLNTVAGIDGGYTYEDYAEGNQDILDPGERLMTPEEFILDQFGWHLVLEEEQRQFARYWPEFMKLDGFNIIFSTSTVHDEPPDAGRRMAGVSGHGTAENQRQGHQG